MVDSMSSWSSLEITRNPFDNGREERTNCPGFSPSMFCHQETPESQKNPADIDEFPIQEYSSTFEREEDEIAAQKAVDEYFSQSFIVPSPWTPNNEAKHVKFSPLPPATAYIEAESSVESSYSSPSSSKCKPKVDASSQTRLSLPPDFDLQKHLGSTYYNQDGLNGSKDISLSSLRRKLFMQVESQNATEKDLLELKSILKSPKSPVLVTSSPVSDQSTPRHAIKNRHSTASTMSSPNISPIKPLLSVPETPTSTRRPYLSRQSLSPMECSTNVFESSGIEIIGDALPDLSPIKANSRTTHSNLETEAEHVENPNTSLDDGGPLEVSALSVKDDNEAEEKEVEDIDNDDDEMPPKITMEDLADDLDSTEENGSAHSKDSPQIKFEEPTPRLEPVPDENAAAEAMDTGNVRSERLSTSAEHPELPKESSMQVEDVGSNFSQEPKSYDHSTEHPRVRKDYPSRHTTASSHRNWQTKNYSTTESFRKSSLLNELDEDVIMMRAKAALRRANRFSPTQGVCSHSYDPHSLTLSDLSLNASSAWEPVRMSTPLAPHFSNLGNYRGHRDHDSPYGYKSFSRSHRHGDSAGVTYSEESGLGRSGGNMASNYSHGVSGKRLSPAVEDLIRRRNLQGGYEGRYPLSSSWKKSSSPLFSSKYDSKWKLSHTHPMSYVEWKALYWRPPRDHFTRRDRQYQTNQYGYESDFKRSSWPPRPMSSKQTYGSRPLSPPVTFPPAKVPRAVPGGFVSKIALPSYQDNSDSGYSDWQRGGSQWENTVRSQNSSLGYAGELHYYY